MRKLCYEEEVHNYSKRFQDFKIKSKQGKMNIGVTLKYHDLLHEENKLELYKNILNWISKVKVRRIN